MQRLAMFGAAAAVVAITAAMTLAGPPPEPCCACIPLNRSTPEAAAAFCGFFPPGAEHAAAEIRCDNSSLSGPFLYCLNASAEACRQDLAEAAILCPAAGAPAASTGILSALVALLGLVGYFTARRRARS
ncbi:MAG: hypothetical protein SF182_09225 [Deltaproteobacteria bacterium]|nr:hypothetical protein [Deltaproteobacteria bacterium]